VKASDFQSSTKIEALLDEINQMISGDPSAKAAPQHATAAGGLLIYVDGCSLIFLVNIQKAMENHYF